MEPKFKRLLSLILLVVLSLGLSSCAEVSKTIFPERAQIKRERKIRELKKQESPMQTQAMPEPLIDPSKVVKLRRDTVNLALVGDVLIHIPIINAAKQADGSYDFAYSYRYIEPEIQKLDYAAFNMEGTLAGEPYEGYPIFSAPDILAPTLKKVGFDLAFAANNHCMDRGLDGLKMTAKKLKAEGFDLVGIREAAADDKVVVKELNNLKLGFFNFTYETERIDGLRSLNGIPVPEEGEDLLDSFSLERSPEDLMSRDLERMVERIKELKAANVDLIVALLHWGDEYHTTANATQVEIANFLAAQGVDLIVGAGPHVAQEVKWLERPDGKRTLCYYSLGNFISNQQFDTADNGGYAEDGLVALVRFERGVKGPAKITKAGYLPLYCFKIHPENDQTFATVLPVMQVLEDPAKFQFDGGEELLERSLQRTREVMSQNSEGIQLFGSVDDFLRD
ncbi:MAG: CapA family protein [Eubacteriales bacterium]|nr:CapA family protein [Eubacteriales bacterium]